MIVSAWVVLPSGLLFTPTSVLVELYKCFGFNVKDTSDETLRLSLEKCIIDSNNLEEVACFCNPTNNVTWKSGMLVRKFEKMIRFFTEQQPLPTHFIMSYPTPTKKNTYTPLQVYLHSQILGFRFQKDITLAEIERSCREAMTLPTNHLPPGVFHQLWLQHRATPTDLINLYHLSRTPETPVEFDVYLLKTFSFYNKKGDVNYFRFQEFMKYGETEAFERTKPNVNDYFIDEVIHPEVPAVYYDPCFLKSFGETYTQAVQESLMNHFYLGKDYMHLQNTETPIELADVVDLTECFSYGVPGQGLTVFTVNEVYETIRRKRTFYTPDDRQLTSAAVQRLINITVEYPELQKLCREVQQEQASGGEFGDFVCKYHNFSESFKENILQTFWDLLYAGFYMRGWDGYSEYPLKRGEPGQNTMYDVSRYLYSLKTKGDPNVLSLPIMRYENDEYIYEMCHNKKQTIIERIKLLIESSDQNNACIRVASNWFVCTAHRYLSALTKPLSFAASDVVYFSQPVKKNKT